MHPDDLLKVLLQSTANAKHKDLLVGLHQICRAQHNTSKDFSRRTVGRICEATGLFKARILYNEASGNHRALIDCWHQFACTGKGLTPTTKPDAPVDVLLLKIPDLALRSYVQTALADLKKKTAEVNLLKSQLSIRVVEPVAASHLAGQPLALIQQQSRLTASEVEALEKAISTSFLEQEGWSEGRHGDVRNEQGRVLFGPGFSTGVRKALNVLSVRQSHAKRTR